MGIFFRSAPVATLPPIRTTSPAGERIVLPEQMSQEVAGTAVAHIFSWGRLAIAVILLLLMFIGGVYCSRDPLLADWDKMLIHGFELSLGLVIGLLTGEAAATR